MVSGIIELTLRPNLWYNFEGRLLHGLEDYSSGKKISSKH